MMGIEMEKTIEIQRLVAQAFIPNPNNLPCGKHKSHNGYLWEYA